jgi:hypothetical protein
MPSKALMDIIKRAKAMRIAYPKKYAKWTDYVKAASKPGVLKSVGKITVKKAPVKKTVAKKPTTKSLHKDINSHNVRINIVSGVNKALKRYNDTIKEIQYFEENLIRIKKAMPNMTKLEKQRANEVVRSQRKLLSELKTHAKELKKII